MRHVSGARHWSERDPGSVDQALTSGGSFALRDLPTGPGRIVLRLAGGALDGWLVVRRVEPARGPNRIGLALESAELRGVPPGQELALWAQLDATTFALRHLAGSRARRAPLGMPTAEHAWLVQPGREPDPREWRKLATLVLHAGEWTLRD